jgi:hypothetical protein
MQLATCKRAKAAFLLAKACRSTCWLQYKLGRSCKGQNAAAAIFCLNPESLDVSHTHRAWYQGAKRIHPMSFCNHLLRASLAPGLAFALAVALAVGMVLILGGCSSTPPSSRGAAAYGAPQGPSISQEQAHDVTIYALGLVGTPYRYGGNTPESGFDCSGLIGHVYRSRAQISLPRNVAGLQRWGQQVSTANLRSGDLVLFGQTDVATHAGIYVGDGRFVHAPSSGGEVRLDRLNSKYWAAQKAVYRRP